MPQWNDIVRYRIASEWQIVSTLYTFLRVPSQHINTILNSEQVAVFEDILVSSEIWSDKLKLLHIRHTESRRGRR